MNISSLFYYLKRIYLQVINSIAFYPTALSVGMLALAWLCLYIDAISYAGKILEIFSFLIVRNPETARSILTTLAGGLISLMVFSFSMVMIVLSQTASSYSPRVLPGLISKREHQIVLGLYLGTIGYTLAVLSNVDSEAFKLLVPRFSIAVNLLLGFCCFAAFIYFIHNMSAEIQVGNILKRLYHQTRSTMLQLLSEGNFSEIQDFETKQEVKAWQSGYFFSISENTFLRGAKQHNLQVKLLKNQGEYFLKGEPFLEVNQPVTEKVQKLLTGTFMFRHQEMITDNFLYGFKQITEVAVKALSPGINDPGTALQAIDYLADLFQILLKLKGKRVVRYKGEVSGLLYLPVPFKKIFYLCVASLRNYAEKDVAVQAKLIYLIKKTAASDREGTYSPLYEDELKAIITIAEKSLKNPKDIEYLRDLAEDKMKD